MKYSIDVLICDSDFVVREIKKRIPPNRLYFWNPLYRNVIEMPNGSVKSKNIKIGDQLQLEILK